MRADALSLPVSARTGIGDPKGEERDTRFTRYKEEKIEDPTPPRPLISPI